MESIKVNQSISISLGLNASEALVLGYLVAQKYESGYWVSLSMMTGDMSLISDKPDTHYRILKSLAKKSAISLTKTWGDEYTFTLDFDGDW